ncbi:aldo/keto reductase family protein [Rhizoctonia solani]|uniref:Aldo/keto reductase family protein n=1 Tax=Rhizoctonia solani TaxID=456999 RepID=A0A8H8NXD6_9AGAM|nr:aldo/keto reductase family protein [Rhizoctonia solani]QRW21140.1 aldo/keto reductase family protein [Rhizoctonia solani]
MASADSPKKMTYGLPIGQLRPQGLALILGLASYGNKSWEEWVIGEEEGIEHIKAAYDAGIQTFIPQMFIPMASLNAFWERLSSNSTCLEMRLWHSLERLQLDYVDVFQCHRFDYDTPIAETMQALHDVVKAGYARYIGMSSCHAYQFHAMQNYAINNNLTPFISMQNQYNLIYREEEREMMPTLKMFGVGMIPWSPLSQGVLSRPYSQTSLRAETSVPGAWAKKTKEDNKEIIVRLENIAKARGISMAQVAIAWELSKSDIVAPIIGATKLERLKDTIGAIDVKLTDEEIQQLEEGYVAQPIQGYI